MRPGARAAAFALLLLALAADVARAETRATVYVLMEKAGMVFGPLDARYDLRGDEIDLELGPEGSRSRPSSPVRVAAVVPPHVQRQAPRGTYLVGRNRNSWFFFTR